MTILRHRIGNRTFFIEESLARDGLCVTSSRHWPPRIRQAIAEWKKIKNKPKKARKR